MRKAPGVHGRRGAVLVCCLAALALGDVRAAPAGIRGSYHDFSSGPLAAAGRCTPCHRPHGSWESLLLWPRPLVEERGYFTQTSDPNYVADASLLCYDCHDDGATSISPAVDEDPSKHVWASGHAPQDIAGAHRAGLRGILVLSGRAQPGDVAGLRGCSVPDAVGATLEHVVAALD